MKHFVGGWAFGTIISTVAMAAGMKKSTPLIYLIVWCGLFVGPLFGLAAWGLLP